MIRVILFRPDIQLTYEDQNRNVRAKPARLHGFGGAKSKQSNDNIICQQINPQGFDGMGTSNRQNSNKKSSDQSVLHTDLVEKL